MEVRLKDGNVLRSRAHRADTGALRGVTMEDIRKKFRDCAAQALPEATAAEILSRLDRLEEEGPVSSLTDLLRG